MTRSPSDVARAALAADCAYDDPALWIARVPDEAILARAAVLEAEGQRDRPLWGQAFAIKDNLDVAGLPTTAACPGYAYTPEATAPAVQRLLDAGAMLLGKTNMDQFATGLVGTRSPYGTPRNPFDPSRVPGGSSSGSAVAVAAGIARFALGTDTAGSGRVPAAFCNVVGLKPTLGSISARGLVPACRSVDAVSVFARSVDEALSVLRVVAAYDEADPYSRRAPFPHLRRGEAPAAARVAGIVDEGVVAGPYARAASLLGAEAVDIAEFLAVARLLYDGPWVAERTAALRGVVEGRPEILHPSPARSWRAALPAAPWTRSRRSIPLPAPAAWPSNYSPATTPCCCRRRCLAPPSPRSRPTRSASTRGSGPGPISPIFATWPPSPCRPGWARTGCRSA